MGSELCAIFLPIVLSPPGFGISLAASCSLQQEPQPLLPQLRGGDQEGDKEGYKGLPAQENGKASKQFHAFEIPEVLIVLLLVVIYMFKRAVRTLGLS